MRKQALAAMLVLLAIACGGNVLVDDEPDRDGGSAVPQTGVVTDWPESRGSLQLTDAGIVYDPERMPANGLVTWWSYASSESGYWYGANEETWVAMVPNVSHVSEITDASLYTYGDWSTGPVEMGQFAIATHPASNRYVALRFDAITDSPGDASPYGYAAVTWYLDQEGDFSQFADSP